MKKCPYCAEDIQDAAVVCKHCSRDLPGGAEPPKQVPVTPKKKTGVAAWGCLTIIILLVAGFCVSQLGESGRPSELSPAHRAAVEAALKASGFDQPSTIELASSGFIVAEYVISDPSIAIRARSFGEARLLAIREALLPFGFKDYRVNVNGPPPGTGLVRRYGSARFIGIGGKLEWQTP